MEYLLTFYIKFNIFNLFYNVVYSFIMYDFSICQKVSYVSELMQDRIKHLYEVSLRWERFRGRGENSWEKRLWTNTYYEVSLRGRRETSGNLLFFLFSLWNYTTLLEHFLSKTAENIHKRYTRAEAPPRKAWCFY